MGGKLQTLVETTKAIWNAQIKILAYIQQLQENGPTPDIRYTWAQMPVRFEDAFGRVLPIPSEYNWGV